MTLLELLYFTFVALGAFLAAQWLYHHVGWVWAVIGFGVVLWGCLRFFFTGALYRVVSLIFRLKD